MNNRRKIIIIMIAIILIAIIVMGILKFSNISENEEEKETLKFLYNDENNFYYIDEKEKIYTYEGYKSIGDFYNGLAVFSKIIDNKKVYGVMDKNENEIIKSGNYTDINEIENTENYIVENNYLYGVIDKREKIILPIEYKSISAFSAGIYLVETSEDKYYYLASNGKIIKETENYGMFTTQVYSQPTINEEYDELISIDKKYKYYNARTGEKIFDTSDEIDFEYNILFEEKKAISLYDKNLKLKERIETPNTNSISIQKLEIGYIVLKENIPTENCMKYRIYDEDLNLKKEVECPNTKNISIEEMDKEHFYIEEESNSNSKKRSYKTTIYDKNLKEYTRITEGQSNAQYWIAPTGEILFAEEDKDSKDIRIYNSKEENIANISMENYISWKIKLNYILLKTPGRYAYYDVYNESGKLVAEKVYNIWNINGESENYKDKFVEVERSGKEYSVLLQDGTEIKEKGYKWRICGESLIAFNSTSKQMKIYNLQGKLKNEITDIEDIEVCTDTYIILKNSNKYRVYNSEKGKIVFEFDKKMFNYECSNKGMDYIELEDGFYSFEGNKLLEKIKYNKK